MSKTIVVTAWPWVAGLLLGMLVVPALVDEYAALRDIQRAEALRREPVIRTEARVVRRTQTETIISVTGEKLRPCTFKGLQAYTLHDGVMRSTSITRDDQPPLQATRPVGRFDAGQWTLRMSPRDEAVVWAGYDCGDGTALLNVFARVEPE